MILRLKKWMTDNRSLIRLGIGVILFYLCLFALGITCPIKYLSGVSCAGCGMSRAWFHALTLDFVGALAYHPIFWIVPIIAFFLFWQKKHPLSGRIALGFCLGLMLTVYLIRLFDPVDTIVVFAPEDGAIYHLGRFLVTHIIEWLN